MIKVLFEFLEFLRSCAPLFVSLGVLTLFFTLAAKSIKKHSTIYYIAFSLPFLMYLIPFLCGLMGIETIDFVRVPIVGEILRDYIHVGALAHPMLIIIMYVGALSPKNPIVKKLLSIRKEISIISGFPILTHSLVRVINNLPNALKFFTNNAEYLENTTVVSELGAGISSFSFVLGVVLLIIFLPLWVTSFDWVRKHMSGANWKKLQKWSYVLYALLFVHAMGIQVGGMLNPRVPAPQPPVEVTAPVTQAENRGSEQATRPIVANQTERQTSERPTAQQARRAPSKGISDINVSRQARSYIHISSLLLVYGSYLFFRLRKAKRAKKNKIKS
jgi:Predicted membrane protein